MPKLPQKGRAGAMNRSGFKGKSNGEMEKPEANHPLSYQNAHLVPSGVRVSSPTFFPWYLTKSLSIEFISSVFSVLVLVDGFQFLHRGIDRFG